MLYIQNNLSVSIEKVLGQILLRLIREQPEKMVRLGFVYLLQRVIKRQHELIAKYISKNVENLQLKNNYAVEAEFRVNAVSALL